MTRGVSAVCGVACRGRSLAEVVKDLHVLFRDQTSHMRTASISELKARLSAFLDVVRAGEDVMVTDRGRLIARLTPVLGDEQEEGRSDLLRSGRLRAPKARLAADFLKRRRPHDDAGASLSALRDEREDGR